MTAHRPKTVRVTRTAFARPSPPMRSWHTCAGSRTSPIATAAPAKRGPPDTPASVDYVAKALEDKGFDVQTPEFELGIFHVDAESLTVDGAPVAARAVEYSGATSAAGVTGPLVAVSGGRHTRAVSAPTTTACRSRAR